MKTTLLCARCNNPKIIKKSWVEIIKTSAGKSELIHTQLGCSDKECEKEFMKKTAEEVKKRELMKLRNESYAAKKAAETATLNNPSGKNISLK